MADPPPRLGFGGAPIGEATESQRKPKQDIPCSAFMNTQNKETHMNTERFLNTARSLNHGTIITFKSSDDILEILRTHPDFARVPKDKTGALVAAIISAIVAGGGLVVLFFVSGGAVAASAPLLIKAIGPIGAKALGSGLLTVGVTGGVNFHDNSHSSILRATVRCRTPG